MSISNRTSRRRRIAFGLGATGGGLLAAAFMPMGIALAAPVTTPVDPGLFPIDTETVPDPFADAFDVNGATNPGVSLADQQLDIDNSLVAAQFDYSIDNHIPFTFDGISSTVPSSFTPDAGTTGDVDPFEDALTNTPTASLDPNITPTLAEQYDYALSQLVADGQLTSAQVTQLDGIADGTVHSVTGTLPVVADDDPAADFVQIFDPNAFTSSLPGAPESVTPNDFLGVLAVDYDNFLNAVGLGGPLDQLVDTFTGGLGSTGTDMFTGLTSTIDPLSFLGL
jgi:hypothetical protein